MRKEKYLKEVTQNRSETWPIFVTPSVTYWWNGCRRSRRGERTRWWPPRDCSWLTLLSWRSAQCTGSTLDCPNEETCDVNRAGKAALCAPSTLFTLFGISEAAPCLRLFSWGHQCAAGGQPRYKIQEEKKQGQWVPGKNWQLNLGGF